MDGHMRGSYYILLCIKVSWKQIFETNFKLILYFFTYLSNTFWTNSTIEFINKLKIAATDNNYYALIENWMHVFGKTWKGKVFLT